MIVRKILAAPYFPGGPVHRRISPVRVFRRQTQRDQSRRAEVQTARRNIGFAYRRLMAVKTNLQPSVRIENAGRFNHLSNYG